MRLRFAFVLLLAAALTDGCTLPFLTPTTRQTTATPVVVSAPAPPPPVPAQPVKEALPLHLPTPQNVRGIYVTGWVAGIPARLDGLIQYLKANGLNAVVLDVKDDDGRLSFPLPGTKAEAIGADEHKVADIAAVLRLLHENKIYVIGRVVSFVDPYYSQKRPDLAITRNGKLWHDGRNLTWLNPWKEEARAYDVEIGVAAAKLGFDEIQFDYVRFPEKNIPGVTEGTTEAQRTEAISAFLKQAVSTIHQEAKVPVSADVFGLTTTVTDDMRIGQTYHGVAATVDYISPMVYPSHYNPGLFGLGNPNAYPYQTVLQSMINGLRKTPDVPLARHRPWLQDFTLGQPAYGPAQVDDQLRALAALGIRSFLLWNPNNVYTKGVNFKTIDGPQSAAAKAQVTAQPAAKTTNTGSGGH